MKITYRKLSPQEYQQALEIRVQVFVNEQKVPIEEEQDSYDRIAVHFGAFDGDRIIATGRAIINEEKAKIGRLAVLQSYRGLGIGKQLVHTIIQFCQNKNLKEVYLGAQLQAIPFYEKVGFTVEGDIFDDAGIPHRLMRKAL